MVNQPEFRNKKESVTVFGPRLDAEEATTEQEPTNTFQFLEHTGRHLYYIELKLVC